MTELKPLVCNNTILPIAPNKADFKVICKLQYNKRHRDGASLPEVVISTVTFLLFQGGSLSIQHFWTQLTIQQQLQSLSHTILSAKSLVPFLPWKGETANDGGHIQLIPHCTHTNLAPCRFHDANQDEAEVFGRRKATNGFVSSAVRLKACGKNTDQIHW